MSIWAVGVFIKDGSIYSKSVEVPSFMDGREIQDLLNQENDQDGSLARVIMTRGCIPPLQWDAANPALICNAGGNDLLLYSPDGDGKGGQGMSELAWEKEYPNIALEEEG
jgi:hypothetical protein